MRLVTRVAPGVVEMNWMWVPTFLGMDPHLKQHVEEQLRPVLEQQELTDALLDAAHDRVVEIICARYSALPGLRDYLDAVKFVDDTK